MPDVILIMLLSFLLLCKSALADDGLVEFVNGKKKCFENVTYIGEAGWGRQIILRHPGFDNYTHLPKEAVLYATIVPDCSAEK